MSRDRSSDGFVPFALHICRWKAKYQPRNDILRISGRKKIELIYIVDLSESGLSTGVALMPPLSPSQLFVVKREQRVVCLSMDELLQVGRLISTMSLHPRSVQRIACQLEDHSCSKQAAKKSPADQLY